MENNLKDIFQKKLDNYQAPVDASVWNTIQSGISGGVASSAGGGFLASVAAKIAAVIVAASLVVAAIYFTTQKNEVENSKIELVDTKEVAVESEEIVDDSKETVIEKGDKKTVAKLAESKTSATKSSIDKSEAIDTKKVETPSPIVNNNTPESSPKTNLSKDETNQKQTSIPNVYPTPIGTPAAANQEEIIEKIQLDFNIESIDPDELRFQLIPSEDIEDDIELVWSFGNGNTSREVQPTVYYDVEGDYKITLSYINDGVITELATQDVKAFYPISWEIQNIFTPNDDMYNQYFDPSAKAENLTIETLVIYNNQQQVVFTSNAGLKKWDGKLPSGQLATQGYYFYQVSALGNDGEHHTKKGKVYLITGK